MRRAGPVSRAGSVCQDLFKNQLRSYMEKSQPGLLGSWYRDAGIPARRAENLPCNRYYRANIFLSLKSASEQNGSPEGQYFSFYVTQKGLSDHKAT